MISRRAGTQHRAGSPVSLNTATAPNAGIVIVAPQADIAGVLLIAEAVGRWEPAGLVNTSGKVSQWTNTGTAGSSLDVTQSNSALRPTYSATGNRSGGPAATFVAASTTYIESGAYTVNQPNTVIAVAKRTGADVNAFLCDGLSGDTRSVYRFTAIAKMWLSADGAEVKSVSVTAPASGNWMKIAAISNSTSSFIRVDATTSATGDAGNSSSSGMVMGTHATHVVPWDGPVEAMYLWNRALSTTEVGQVFQYLG